MPGLPITGTLSYNGYSFDGATHVQTSQTPVRDEANRTVIYVEIAINVTAIIAVRPTDGSLENIRKRLSQDSGPLIYSHKGFSQNLRVNVGGGVTDVKFGPKTDVVRFTPIGDNNAAEVSMTIRTWIPDCPWGTHQRDNGILAFNYDVNYSRDEGGYVTRTISGYIEIALNRKGRFIHRTADQYAEWFKVRPPKGFKRTQSRHVSKDKRRLDFSITDQQIKTRNAYPTKTIAISGGHRLSWGRSKGGSMIHRNSISMNIEPEFGTNPSNAWAWFAAVVTQRMRHTMNRGKWVLLDSLEVSEDLYGMPVSFSAGYRFIGAIRDFIGDSGIWRPLPGDWDLWQTSLSGSMFAPRGLSGLTTYPEEDFILDPCGPDSPITVGKQAKTPPRPVYAKYILQNEQPPPEKSWIKYDTVLRPSRVHPTARLSYMQTPPIDRQDPHQTTGVFAMSDDHRQKNDEIQKSGAPRYSMSLVGHAMRAGHEIPRPKLQAKGQVLEEESDSLFELRTFGNFLGVTVYSARWALNYILDRPPETVSPVGPIGKPDEGIGSSGVAEAPRSK